ncbi:hypothetical protein BUALT_Bualt15G0086500 [Buddleja alternifolia]|uniref:Uncharacterized protein n=1 Tax=Buddleja alternifolia TaxID=168488 RepID=A0AAV6WPB3_9LAMI|nr:hypothetical protein BUALT_Bualt15G0086500 [Buddleja alternifolia]
METTYSIHGASVQMVMMYKECLPLYTTMRHKPWAISLMVVVYSRRVAQMEPLRQWRVLHDIATKAIERQVMETRAEVPISRDLKQSQRATTGSCSVTKEEIGGVCSEIGMTRMALKKLDKQPNAFSGVQIQEASERQVMETRVEVPRKRLSREQTKRLKAISESNHWKLFRH